MQAYVNNGRCWPPYEFLLQEDRLWQSETAGEVSCVVETYNSVWQCANVSFMSMEKLKCTCSPGRRQLWKWISNYTGARIVRFHATFSVSQIARHPCQIARHPCWSGSRTRNSWKKNQMKTWPSRRARRRILGQELTLWTLWCSKHIGELPGRVFLVFLIYSSCWVIERLMLGPKKVRI